MSDTQQREIPTELALPKSEAFAQLGELCQDISLKLKDAPTEMERMARRAIALNVLGKCIDGPVLKAFMHLQGSPLGFRTDKDRNRDGSKGPGYSEDIVRDVAIQTLIIGLSMDGNVVNIIGGNMYVTQQGFERLVFESIEGALEEIPGIPQVKGDACYVTYGAKWKYGGEQMELKNNYVLQANTYIGFDAYLGKARRRMLRDVYRRITGINLGLAEPGDVDRMKRVSPEKPSTAADASGSSLELEKEGAAS